jgi:hypothetical protein
MINGYLTFLDYLELRRRIERRLASGKWFLMHVVLFGIGTSFIGFAGWSPYYNAYRNYFIDSSYGILVAGWSILLLVHGLWSYWQSGLRAGKRDETIEREMREKVRANDLYLRDHSKELFRLHGLLNTDIRIRSGMIQVPLLFVFINAMIWISGTIIDYGRTPFSWTFAPFLVPPLVLVLLWNMWRRGRHEAKLRVQMEQIFDIQLNQSFEDDYEAEREMRLSEDDELVTLDEYMMKRKRN